MNAEPHDLWSLLRMLPLLDVAIALLVLLAALGGWRRGASTQAARLAGALGGFVLGGVIGQGLIEGEAVTLTLVLVQLGCALVGALLGAGLGGRAGRLVHRGARGIGLAWVDNGAGAVLRAGLALAVCWLVAAVVVVVGPPSVVAVVRDSRVLGRLDAALPAPGRVAAAVLPARMAAYVPLVAVDPQVPAGSRLRVAVERATPATVKVLGISCTSSIEGSGFSAGDGLVVTNAHVVHGVTRPSVVDQSGAHPATPILYDPDADVAVLRVSDLGAPRLPISAQVTAPGTQGAVLGYPGNGPLTVSPAVITLRSPEVARRVGGGGIGVREDYRLAATVRPGNSGGPLVDTAGRVLGLVTSRSLTNPHVGYALASPRILHDVGTAARATAAATTGGC